MTAMTAQEQFRAGFLMRCAEDGCTMDDVRQRVKMANPLLVGAGIAGGQGLVNAFSGAKNILYDYMKSPAYVAALGLTGATVLGGAAGHTLGKVQSQDADPEEMKKQELLQAYKTQASRIKQLASLRESQPKIRSPRLLH